MRVAIAVLLPLVGLSTIGVAQSDLPEAAGWSDQARTYLVTLAGAPFDPVAHTANTRCVKLNNNRA